MQLPPKPLSKGIDCIGVCVIFFCHDGTGNYVMAKRSTNARDENGRWDMGAGAVELGDTIEQTITQEVQQEYCTNVISFEFLGYRDVHREHNGQKTHWIALDFKVLIDPTKVKNGEPHKFDEIGWFKLNALPENLHSTLSTSLALYKDKL